MPAEAKYIDFVRLTSESYNNLETKNPDAIYFLTDTNQICVGATEYIPADVATQGDIAEAISTISGIAYKGTLGEGGTATELPTEGVKAGDLYRVITAGEYAGNECNPGDAVFAIETTDEATDASWVIIQNWTAAEIEDLAATRWESDPAGSWAAIKATVAAGRAEEVFQVGDELPTKYKYNGTVYDVKWRVLGFNHNGTHNTMDLEMTSCTCVDLYWSHYIANAVVIDHTLSSGDKITLEDDGNMVYEGEMSSLNESTILAAEDYKHVWKYTGSAATLTDGTSIAANDILSKSKDGTKVAKVTNYSLAYSSGEYEIEAVAGPQDIEVGQSFAFLFNKADYLYPYSIYLGFIELTQGLFTGCQYLNGQSSIFPKYNSRTALYNSIYDNSIEEIYNVDVLPDLSEADSYGLYILSTDGHGYKKINQSGTNTWKDLGVIDELPPTSPVAYRGSTDYTASDARVILNSDQQVVFDPATWEPSEVFGIFDHIPRYEGEGFIYQLQQTEDESTLDFLQAVSNATNKVFDGSYDYYSGYVPSKDKWLANAEYVDNNHYPQGSYYTFNYSFIYADTAAVEAVAASIDAGTFVDDYGSQFEDAESAQRALEYGLTGLFVDEITLPNGEHCVGNILNEGQVFGLITYLPEDGVETVNAFHQMEFANDQAMGYTDKLSHVKNYTDKFFLLGGAEMCAPRSAMEGEPYPYYSDVITEPTWDSNDIRIKKRADGSDASSSYGHYYWIKSMGGSRDYVCDVNCDGYVYGGDPTRSAGCLGPACRIGA